MAYPQYQNGFAPQGYQQPGYPPQQLRPPSAGTAVTAIILAYCGAAVAAFALVETALGAVSDEPLTLWGWYGVVGLVVPGVIAVFLGLGATLMVAKKAVGRWLVALGCAVALLYGALLILAGLGFGILVAGVGGADSDDMTRVIAVLGGLVVLVVVVVVVIPAVLTAVLALVPSTRRWLNQPRNR